MPKYTQSTYKSTENGIKLKDWGIALFVIIMFILGVEAPNILLWILR